MLRPIKPFILRGSRAHVLIPLAMSLVGCSSAETPTGPPPTLPPSAIVVPEIAREFRGLWIATVANIDWPSRAGLSMSAQQGELTAILDAARNTGLNAVVLQVRANGDALYRSTLEPWSRSLTGQQGGDPGWDPLTYAVQQAHARGLELHAWFNPFRAGNLSDSARMAANHFAKVHPEIVRAYCTQLWFDPGEPSVQDHAIAVVRDVVQRYAIDAVHLDDYFYPYPDSRCAGLQFPDSAGHARHVAGGGNLTRNDWRRDNVNRFVERLYREVHLASATTRVGLSPFGIWRPGNPAGITGLDAYASIYADSRLWLQRGWLDYMAPQLYWSIASTGQSFPALLDWWTQQNTQDRHLWPGLAAYRVADGSASAFSASEIAAQVLLVRARKSTPAGPTGTLLYNTSSLMQNRDGLRVLLSAGAFATRAVVPATPWLDAQAPAPPTITVAGAPSAALRLVIAGDGGEPLAWWLVRWRVGGVWSMSLVPPDVRITEVPNASSSPTDAVAVHAIDRVGNASAAAVWRLP